MRRCTGNRSEQNRRKRQRVIESGKICDGALYASTETRVEVEACAAPHYGREEGRRCALRRGAITAPAGESTYDEYKQFVSRTAPNLKSGKEEGKTKFAAANEGAVRRVAEIAVPSRLQDSKGEAIPASPYWSAATDNATSPPSLLPKEQVGNVETTLDTARQTASVAIGEAAGNTFRWNGRPPPSANVHGATWLEEGGEECGATGWK